MPIGESSRLDVRDARSLFPGLSGRAFLDAACVSLAPSPAIGAVEDFLVMAATCEERDASLYHVAMDRLRGRAVLEGAALLGAATDEIALVESTTHGLNIAAQVIPFEPGDKRRDRRPRVPASSDPVGEAFDERIYVSLRYTSGVGGIRVPTHYFNDESDLEKLLGAVRRLSKQRLGRLRAHRS